MADESRPDSLDPGMDEALARFWNALGQGAPPDHAAIDPALVDTVRHVHLLGAAKPPDPAVVQRLRDELFVTGLNTPAHTRPADGFRMNGRAVSRAPRQPSMVAHIPQQHRWGFVAGAVTLLLALGVGI